MDLFTHILIIIVFMFSNHHVGYQNAIKLHIKNKVYSSVIHFIRLLMQGLGTVISDTNDGTEEIRARVLAANKFYSSLQTIFRSKHIHRNKIRLYTKILMEV